MTVEQVSKALLKIFNECEENDHNNHTHSIEAEIGNACISVNTDYEVWLDGWFDLHKLAFELVKELNTITEKKENL
jgi:hypothetical protein